MTLAVRQLRRAKPSTRARAAGWRPPRIGLALTFSIRSITLLQRKVAAMRTFPTAPADVVADSVFGDAFERVVHASTWFSAHFRKPAMSLAQRIPPVADVDEDGIVDLEDETGIGDGLVFFPHGLRDRPCIVLPLWSYSVVLAGSDSVAGDTAVTNASSGVCLPRTADVRSSIRSRLTACCPTYLTGPVQVPGQKSGEEG